MSRLFYILKKKAWFFAYNATAITIRVMGCIDAKKISPDCPSGNFQENMHSLRKVYFCAEKLTFSIHLNLSSYRYIWKTISDLRGRRVIMPSGLVLFCFYCIDSRTTFFSEMFTFMQHNAEQLRWLTVTPDIQTPNSRG